MLISIKICQNVRRHEKAQHNHIWNGCGKRLLTHELVDSLPQQPSIKQITGLVKNLAF